MENYNFTLKFDLPNKNDHPDHFVDALYECGCNDALIGIGKVGKIALRFSRLG